MEIDGSELTRRFLLNSQSRGSLEEVAGEEDLVSVESNTEENEGYDRTRSFLMQVYE